MDVITYPYPIPNASLGNSPDSKVHGANMGPIWGRQDPGGPHVGPMNFVIWFLLIKGALGCYDGWLNVSVIGTECSFIFDESHF